MANGVIGWILIECKIQKSLEVSKENLYKRRTPNFILDTSIFPLPNFFLTFATWNFLQDY